MFYDNFKAICNSKGTSPTAVCKAIGLSNATATKWKSGAHPRADILARLADHLGVSVSDLLVDADSAPKLDLSRNATPLTADEQSLLDAYRTDPALHAAIDAMLVASGHKKKAQDAESFA